MATKTTKKQAKNAGSTAKQKLAAARARAAKAKVDEDDIEEAAAGVGHNGGPRVGGIAGDQLRSFIERIERLEEEKKGIAEDIREVYASAKAVGFDTKIMRKVVVTRKMDQAERQEQEALMDVYLHALG